MFSNMHDMHNMRINTICKICNINTICKICKIICKVICIICEILCIICNFAKHTVYCSQYAKYAKQYAQYAQYAGPFLYAKYAPSTLLMAADSDLASCGPLPQLAQIQLRCTNYSVLPILTFGSTYAHWVLRCILS